MQCTDMDSSLECYDVEYGVSNQLFLHLFVVENAHTNTRESMKVTHTNWI